MLGVVDRQQQMAFAYVDGVLDGSWSIAGLGTLDTGKDATLIVTTGNPLETTTQVEMAFIQGRQVDLSDRHKRLWHKYEEKYRRQQP